MIITTILLVRVGIAVLLLTTRWRARLGIAALRHELLPALLARHLAATGGQASAALAVVPSRPTATTRAKGLRTSPLGQRRPTHNTPFRTH